MKPGASQFEYGVLERVVHLPRGESWTRLSDDEKALLLSDFFRTNVVLMHESTRTYEGGGWDIVSHDVFTWEGDAVVSVVIRRPGEAQRVND